MDIHSIKYYEICDFMITEIRKTGKKSSGAFGCWAWGIHGSSVIRPRIQVAPTHFVR